MKSKTLLLSIISVFLLIVYIAEGTSFQNNLIHYVAKQRNKIPSRFIEPTEAQKELFREAVGFLLRQEFAGATRTAQSVGYTLRSITHINGSVYYILESSDPKRRPWGTYVFYLASDKNGYVIEVPHPVEEKNTSPIGIKTFINSKSTAFLLSGSRKGAGDVTLNPDTFFEAAHEVAAYEEASSDTQTITVQIHGFNKKRYPQIILTSGTPVAIAAMDSFIDNYIQHDFTVGVFDGNQFSAYGATENEQAKFTNGIGGSFIGTFLNQEVHNSKRLSTAVINSISETITSETSASDTTT